MRPTLPIQTVGTVPVNRVGTYGNGSNFTMRDCALAPQTAMRLFEGERGVLVINRPTTNRKRRYCSIRIPGFAYERVIRGLTKLQERTPCAFLA